MQKSCDQGEQRLERETPVRGSDSWASISLLKDLISILLAMGDCNTLKQDMARSAFLEAVPMWTKRHASDCWEAIVCQRKASPPQRERDEGGPWQSQPL